MDRPGYYGRRATRKRKREIGHRYAPYLVPEALHEVRQAVEALQLHFQLVPMYPRQQPSDEPLGHAAPRLFRHVRHQRLRHIQKYMTKRI